MTDKRRAPVGDGYRPSLERPTRTSVTGGYQPTKSVGTNPTNPTPQPSVSPPKKP